MKLKRHKVTQRKWIEGQLVQLQNLLSVAIDNLSIIPGNLSSILGYVAKLIDFGSVVPTDPSMIRRAIHIGAQAGLALMQKGIGGDGPVNIQVGDDHPIACRGHLDSSMVTTGPWIFGFYFALLERDHHVL